MDPRIKKLEAEVENYTRAVAKRERQIEHFKEIIKDSKTKLSSLKKPAKKPVRKKAKQKAKPKTKKTKTKGKK